MQGSEAIPLISQDATGPWEEVKWVTGVGGHLCAWRGLGMRCLGTVEWKSGGEKPGR